MSIKTEYYANDSSWNETCFVWIVALANRRANVPSQHVWYQDLQESIRLLPSAYSHQVLSTTQLEPDVECQSVGPPLHLNRRVSSWFLAWFGSKSGSTLNKTVFLQISTLIEWRVRRKLLRPVGDGADIVPPKMTAKAFPKPPKVADGGSSGARTIECRMYPEPLHAIPGTLLGQIEPDTGPRSISQRKVREMAKGRVLDITTFQIVSERERVKSQQNDTRDQISWGLLVQR